ncbi:hypothetical protein BH23PAT2_BH23PAT2_01010 [soil metagenome]
MTISLKRFLMLIVASIFAVTTMASTGFLSAQENDDPSVSGNGFRISPVSSDLVIEQGQSETLTLTVENPTEIPTTAVPIVNDFTAGDDENGEVLPILDDSAPAPRNSFKSLVGEIDSIELGPREKVDIDVTVSVPSGADAGGYYGIIRFVPENTNDQGNVMLSASVGSIVLVRVPGDLTEQLDLVQLSAAQGDSLKRFFTGGDVSVLVRLENSGDIHLRPFGKIQVKNIFGNVVDTYELNSTQPRGSILPDTIRRFQDDLQHNNWFGRYTIEANVGYSQGAGELVSAQTTFWYIPAWALIVLFVALLAVAFGVVSLVNRRGGSGKRAVGKKKK